MYDYDLRSYSVQRKRSKTKVLGVSVAVFIATIGIIWFTSTNKREHAQASESRSAVAGIADFVKHVTQKDTDLQDVVESSLRGSQGEYAVVIENKKLHERYALNENNVYDAASLYKLWIMATTYQLIEQGKFKETDALDIDVSALNAKFHIATDAAELKEGTIHFTVGTALQQMITISHNYAALSLAEKVKLSTVRAFLKKEGFTQSTLGGDNTGPSTTAADISLFFQKLQEGKLANAQHTRDMLDLLKKQKLNGKLPKYLPEDVIVAHKTGELGMMTHDAGIVYTSKGNYIIVVLSKSSYPPGAQERIADLSKEVYSYFEKKE